MSSRLVFFQVSPRRHSNKVTFQGTKYRQTGYLKVVLGCIFYFLFFTLLLKRALLVAEIVIIIGGAAFGPPQGRWESEQADEERWTLCLRQRCLDERLIRIWPCYCHHLVAAVHIRPDADSQDAPCFRAYLYINEVYTCSIFFFVQHEGDYKLSFINLFQVSWPSTGLRLQRSEPKCGKLQSSVSSHCRKPSWNQSALIF